MTWINIGANPSQTFPESYMIPELAKIIEIFKFSNSKLVLSIQYRNLTLSRKTGTASTTTAVDLGSASII